MLRVVTKNISSQCIGINSHYYETAEEVRDNMNTELISIIVPVYNVDRYLTECIDSLICQTYQNLEILLIDDGSTDKSGLICDKYAQLDKRIRVVHQKNQGLSATRNLGIRISRGEYIAFVDSDDCVHCEFIGTLYSIQQKMDSKISVCYYQRFSNSSEIDRNSTVSLSNRFLNSYEALSLLNEWISKNAITMQIICNKLYRKEVFENINFPIGKLREDEFVIHRILACSERISLTDSELYFYRKRNGSIMASNDLVDNFKHLALHEALIDRIVFFSKHDVRLVNGAVHHLLRESNGFYDVYLSKKDKIHNQKRKYLVKQFKGIYFKYFKHLEFREKAVGFLFAFFPRMYHWLVQRRGRRNGIVD